MSAYSISFLDEIRRTRGIMTIGEIEVLVKKGNTIFDPFSVLISAAAKIGTGNVIFPCVSLFCSGEGDLLIGNGNTFFSNSLVEAAFGPIIIGSSNQFGEGGFTAKTNRPETCIKIANSGRYLNGAAVFGTSALGTGSQILGAITVDSCCLESGESFMDADPDRRAGLLKGFGVARNLTVPAGQVILGAGLFSISDIRSQNDFHPERKKM